MIHLLKRDLAVTFSRGGGLLQLIFFYLIVVTLFPLAVGDTTLFLTIGAGVIWVAALLSSQLSLSYLLERDYQDGTLEQLILHGVLPSVIALMKMLSHWLVSGLPLILLTPVLGVMLHLPAERIEAVCYSLILGTPALSMLGTIGASITLGARKGGLLIPLLLMPLTVPVLIFGVGMAMGSSGSPALWLGLIVLGLFPLSLVAASLAIREAVNE